MWAKARRRSWRPISSRRASRSLHRQSRALLPVVVFRRKRRNLGRLVLAASPSVEEKAAQADHHDGDEDDQEVARVQTSNPAFLRSSRDSSPPRRARKRRAASRCGAPAHTAAVYTVASSNSLGRVATSLAPAVLRISVACVQPITFRAPERVISRMALAPFG